MSLQQQINSDFIAAMKEKNEVRVSVLRMLKSALHNQQIAEHKGLSDDDVIKVVQKEIKQRRDSIERYISGNRSELADKEKKESEILEKYLPAQLSDQELTKIIGAAISETDATTLADIGKVMGLVMPQVTGRADGGTISAKVKELLTE